MRSQWKRLMWAAFLSCAGFGTTISWYHLTKNKTLANSNEKPLAFVGKVSDEIQRRPATRLLWQEVSTGEPLFNGEAIRTSEKGEVRIQFADSSRYLDLEPESLIVIQKSKGEIALDLMEGSLFVAAAPEGSAGSETSLVLNSSSGKVDLTQASASLSKSGNNQVDVQVLKGSASIKDKNGQDKVLSSGSGGALGANGLQSQKVDLQITSPVPGKVSYIDPDDKESMSFQWKGFAPGLKVSLYTGAHRKELKEWTAVSNVTANSLKTTLPLGKPYWKLVAKDPQTLKVVAESPVYRSEVQARYAPTVIFPMAEAKIPVNNKGPFDMTFKWQKGDETSQVILEIAKDPSLKQKVATQSFTTEEAFTLSDLAPGEYYWRMSSYYAGSEKPLLGKVQKFNISKFEEKNVAADPVEISWTVPEEKIQFYLDQPQLDLTWNTTRPQDVASWRLRYFEESEDPATGKTIEIKDTKTATPVAKPGRYIASLEAIDKTGQVIGTSPQRKIAVAPLPLLPSPRLLPLEGPLSAKADGRTELRWEKIDGAKEYMLIISNKEGKQLKTLKYTSTETALKNLMPGEYQLTLTAVDQHGRPSDAGETRRLIVPDKSNLKAPTLKKIKVN